jgi:hypothetical protein
MTIIFCRLRLVEKRESNQFILLQTSLSKWRNEGRKLTSWRYLASPLTRYACPYDWKRRELNPLGPLLSIPGVCSSWWDGAIILMNPQPPGARFANTACQWQLVLAVRYEHFLWLWLSPVTCTFSCAYKSGSHGLWNDRASWCGFRFM